MRFRSIYTQNLTVSKVLGGLWFKKVGESALLSQNNCVINISSKIIIIMIMFLFQTRAVVSSVKSKVKSTRVREFTCRLARHLLIFP